MLHPLGGHEYPQIVQTIRVEVHPIVFFRYFSQNHLVVVALEGV